MELLLDRKQLHLWVKDSLYLLVEESVNIAFQKDNYVIFRLANIKTLYGQCQIVGKTFIQDFHKTKKPFASKLKPF